MRLNRGTPPETLRNTLVIILGLTTTATCGTAFALEASDTMATWKTASPEQKRKLVTDILKRDAPPSIIKCLDAASGVPGHADLPIAEVTKACDADGAEPV